LSSTCWNEMFAVMKRAVGAGFKQAAPLRALNQTRVLTTSAGSTQAAAAAAAAASPAAAPAPNMQDFQVYRWDPESGGKPRYQNYKVRRALHIGILPRPEPVNDALFCCPRDPARYSAASKHLPHINVPRLPPRPLNCCPKRRAPPPLYTRT